MVVNNKEIESFLSHKMVILGNFACAAFICNIAWREGTSCGGITHRKTKLSDMYGYEANELKRVRKDAVQVLAPNITQALGTDSSSFTTEHAKKDDPNDSEMDTYKAHCVNLLKFVRNGCDPLWLNGTLCQDKFQVSFKESDVEKLQESKGANECNNSKESCIENAAASPDQYLDDATRTIHGINNHTATENTKSNQDQVINDRYDLSLSKNLSTNHSVENHVAGSLPNLEETHGTDVLQTPSKTPRGDGIKFSYLSFGVNSSIPSFYTCVINAEERTSSREMSKNSADGETSNNDQNHAKYAFSRIIDIKNSENNILETMIKKEILFGSIEGMIGKVKTKSIDLDKLVNESKNQDSLYAFFENLNVKVYSCKSIQDLYFLFITYNCLEYNLFLKCGALREELWEAHVYMSELYPYTLWKMEKINTENEITLENREIYKQNLKEELKLLCIILELYREIKILKIKPDSCSKHQSLINIHIEKLIELIQMHLKSFYPLDQATTLCYIANRMHNQSSTIKSRHKFDELDSDLLNFFGHGHFTQSVQHSKPSSRKKIDKGRRGLMRLEFFQSIHQLRMVKNTIYILVFTINFANIRPPLDKNQSVTILYNKSQKLSAAEIFQSIFLTKMQYLGLYEIQLNAVLETTKLIKQRRRGCCGCQSADINDSFRILQFNKLMVKYKRDCTFSDIHRLILYRLMILKAMVIEFVN